MASDLGPLRDVEEQANGGHRYQQGRSARGHKRERQALRGEQAHDDAEVHHGLVHEKRRDPERHERAGARATLPVLSLRMSWTSLCDLDELEEGRGKYVEIGGFQLAVFLHGGEVYAMDNTCPHAGAPMAAGSVAAATGCAVCPRHNWAFRLDTGELRDMPGVALTTYKVRRLQRDGNRVVIQADLPIY